VQLIGANRAAPFFHVCRCSETVMSIVSSANTRKFSSPGLALVLTGVIVASRKPKTGQGQ